MIIELRSKLTTTTTRTHTNGQTVESITVRAHRLLHKPNLVRQKKVRFAKKSRTALIIQYAYI